MSAKERVLGSSQKKLHVVDDKDCIMGTVNDVASESVGSSDGNEEILNEEMFLKTASESVIHQCMAEFIDATGNDAVRPRVCMVCTREMWAKEVK